MPEETAASILANSMLMSRIRDSLDEGDELRRIVDEEIVGENEALIQERDQAVANARRDRLEASKAVSSIQVGMDILGTRLSEGRQDADVLGNSKGLRVR
jgi:hypothetical protein